MRYPVEESGALYPATRGTAITWQWIRSREPPKNIVLTVQEYSLFAYRGCYEPLSPADLLARFPHPVRHHRRRLHLHRAALRLLHRRRARPAIGGHAVSVRRHRRHRPLRQPHHDPRTRPGAHRRHGLRPQCLLHGQRTRLDGRHRADRRHARPRRRPDAQAGHPAHLRLHHHALLPHHRRRRLRHHRRRLSSPSS